VLVSEDLASQSHSRTGLDMAGSDHFPIFTTIGGNPSIKNVFLYKLKINKKDLIRFSHTLHDNFVSLESNLSEDTLKAYQQIEHHIKEHLYSFFSADSRTPRDCVSPKRPPPSPRWNLQLRSAKTLCVNILHFLLSLILLNTNESDLAVRKFLKNKKGLVGRNIVHSSITKPPTSEIWALIKIFKKRKFTKSYAFSDLNLYAQLVQATIAKLCLPSCLHLQ